MPQFITGKLSKSRRMPLKGDLQLESIPEPVARKQCCHIDRCEHPRMACDLLKLASVAAAFMPGMNINTSTTNCSTMTTS
eukprot:4906994-Amphidinium_carterae.1